MYEVLAATNAALMPLSAVFMWHFVTYQYARKDEPQNTAVSIFGWSIFFLSIGIFFSSLLYFLWDFDLIYKSTQYKLSVMPRCFFVAGLAMAFHALEIKNRTSIIVGSVILAMIVLTAQVVF